MKYSKDKEFWKSPFRLIQPNLRKIDAINIDVKSIVEEVLNYGANAMLVNGGGIIAWYPTNNPYQDVNEYMTGDILKEFIDIAHSKGIKVLVRMDVSKSFPRVLEENPDWFRRDVDGQVSKHWEMLMTCPTGPYWEEYNFKVVKELLGKYDIDGIFYNAYNYFSCHCDRCNKEFKKETSYDLPKSENWSDPAWRQFVKYRYVKHADYTRRLSEYIENISAGTILTVDTNITSDGYKGIRNSGWETSLIAENTGCITSEAFNFSDRSFPRWIYWAGEEVKIGNHLNHTMIILNYSYNIFNRRAAQPPVQIGYDLMQIAANGGSPAIAFSGTFKQDDRKSLPIIKEIMNFLDRNESEYKLSTPFAELAIVYSQQTADYYGKEEAEIWQRHYRGVYEILVESHTSFTVLHEGALETTNLKKFKCVVLPNIAILSKGSAQKIDQYVEEGGHIIATYETGFYNEAGLKQTDNILKSLNKRLVNNSKIEGSYMKIHNQDLFPSLKETDLIMFLGDFLLTESIEKLETKLVDLTVIPSIKNTTPEFAYWKNETNEKGLCIQDYGLGTTSYLPWCIDQMYNEFGIEEYKRLLVDLIGHIVPNKVISTNLPSTVEITLATRKSGGYLIHLLNATGRQGKPQTEIININDIKIRLKGKFTKAFSLSNKKDFTAKIVNNETEINIPNIGLYEVIVVY